MRIKSLKMTGLAAALVAVGSACIFGVHAQQNPSKSYPSTVSTNWMGYLVVGQDDSLDRISGTPSPTTIRQVEIGLRSDGVVVWREAAKTR